MERMMKIVRGTGKVILALLAGVFMPVLIWVALGEALKKAQEKKHQQVPAQVTA